LIGGRKGIWPVKKYWYCGGGDLIGALHILRVPIDNSISCCSKTKNGVTLVLAYPACPGILAVK